MNTKCSITFNVVVTATATVTVTLSVIISVTFAVTVTYVVTFAVPDEGTATIDVTDKFSVTTYVSIAGIFSVTVKICDITGAGTATVRVSVGIPYM